jgi:hypothetical protein
VSCAQRAWRIRGLHRTPGTAARIEREAKQAPPDHHRGQGNRLVAQRALRR